MNYKNRIGIGVICLVLFYAPILWGQNSALPSLSLLTINLLDQDEHPTPARIRITNLLGQYFAPVDHLANFPITYSQDQEAFEKDVMLADDRRFAYVEGTFKIELPQDSYRFEVVKGFQYVMTDDTVVIAGSNPSLTLHLQKTFELPDTNWYSGDVHVHHINPESALLEMKAEDLNVCNILISDFTKDHDLFRGQIEPISDSKHQIFLGQEYREDLLGHVNLLNIRDGMVQPAGEMRPHQYPLNLSVSNYVHDQGGHISWAHFAAWPGLEGPLGLVLKKIDAVELLCTIDPFHPPIFASGVVPELALNSGLRLWYRLLNCGLHVPITAGTDKMGNLVTVGANRVYAKVEGPLDYQRWVKALTDGKTFVSNSPILSLQVNGKEIGSSLQLSAGDSVEIFAEVRCQFPLDRLEIVVNGELLKSVKMEESDSYAKLQFKYTPRESVWLSARAYQKKTDLLRKGLSLAERRNLSKYQTEFNRYFGTLRPEVPFAHTSPIYLQVDEQPIHRSEDARYFIKYLSNVVEYLKEEGVFPSEEAKQEVLAKFMEGINAFRDLGN